MSNELANLTTPNGVCSTTVFEDSWLWYCDECQQHGTGLSHAEVHFMAEAHRNFRATVDVTDEDVTEEDEGEFMALTEFPVEDWEILDSDAPCDGALMIISEKLNKTFEFGEDYEDDTPNQIADIEKAQSVRKKLGLP